MIGRTYWEPRHGAGWRPVLVLVRGDWRRRAPRNVLVLREDGARVVRPFRGLRRQPPAPRAGGGS